ncbi:hypothetical protein S7335_3006 [Synechococcus sp. PCC 7335]|uniref:hypothetical protein n=1 Tax=Synechococcus sp. (strain ATCC 29403 / PCC 7335) TaxID=91464 RepID=UPI00017ECAC1|nr:hypothetical protein [Synechococcus sp. PCC 7335]EDX85307.1 hypothetical protein S7335_3006 [Synechococcus sp. PCC 7335]
MEEAPKDRGVSNSSQLNRTKELEALRRAMMRTWWRICLFLWLTVGLGCLWWVRDDLIEISEYFTWAAVRSIFLYSRLAGIGIALCVGVTFALLVSESRQILWGLSADERSRLGAQLDRIHEQGKSHPQWQLIHPAKDSPSKRTRD